MSEKRASPGPGLSGHRRVALDSNVLIYLLEGDGPRGEAAARLLEDLMTAQVDVVVATIGIAEVLIGPARSGAAASFEAVASELRDSGIRQVALSGAIAEDAAWLRGRAGLDLVDSIHLSTARAVGATAFVTNDRRLPNVPQLEVIQFDALVAGGSDDVAAR